MIIQKHFLLAPHEPIKYSVLHQFDNLISNDLFLYHSEFDSIL